MSAACGDRSQIEVVVIVATIIHFNIRSAVPSVHAVPGTAITTERGACLRGRGSCQEHQARQESCHSRCYQGSLFHLLLLHLSGAFLRNISIPVPLKLKFRLGAMRPETSVGTFMI